MDEFYLLASDGLTLAVETFGDGPPLIFAHGLTGSRRHSRRQLAPLADCCRVILFDQRGHGDSAPVTDPTLYDARRMASDIAAILDGLGIARAVVGGESMGAATALLFALRWPQRVEKLLLIGPAFGDSPNPGQEQIRAIGRNLVRLGVEEFIAQAMIGEWAAMGLSPAAMVEWASVLRSHDPASLAVACETVADWVILPDLSAVAGLDFPVRIIAWENDPVHPLALARRLASALPDAQLVTVPSLANLFNDVEMVGCIYRQSGEG